jgi:hypothetical protein
MACSFPEKINHKSPKNHKRQTVLPSEEWLRWRALLPAFADELPPLSASGKSAAIP